MTCLSSRAASGLAACPAAAAKTDGTAPVIPAAGFLDGHPRGAGGPEGEVEGEKHGTGWWFGT